MEEWNEYGEIKENLGAGSAADPLVPTPSSAPSTPSKPPKSAGAASENNMLAATPPRSSQKSTMDSHLTTAMRKAGFEAAKKAVDVKSQSRTVGKSRGLEDIDQGGAERAANRSTTTEFESRVGIGATKGGESRIIASAEKVSPEEEDDKVDKKKVKEEAVSELRTLPIRQKPQNLREADEGDDEKGEEEQGEEDAAETRSQQLPTSKPASKTKKSKVDEDEEDEEKDKEDKEDEEDEEDEGDEGDEEEDGGGRQQLPISKPPVKVIKADEDDDDDEDGEDDDEEEDENEKTTRVRPVAPTPTPNTSGNDPPKFKTGGPLLDHRKLGPANKK